MYILITRIYYTVQNIPMYACFLDASKAFDWINYWTLFKNLIDGKCHSYIIQLFVYWHQEQLLYVKRYGMSSDKCHVFNGIKQGGMLFPKLLTFL